ncbi:hypothetical protein GGQ76_001160 [Aureimonas jatrophae]|uniref:Uncharacterized protein n=1 Tax=Aureimonas jatrophae TaxID=1166073 RepID=A0A1H0H043_9HYPH|nr:hypothetical protein [Aureimonas jatrophae]SDO12301.1 hypothetical protein SAMN05192530_103439 [Aureimonas jatrophae]
MIGRAGLALAVGLAASSALASAAEPVRYTVRYGLTLGTFEPVAGEALCIADADCVIPLSLSPRIEISLRGHPENPRWGTAFVFCPGMDCGFGNGRRTTGYGGRVNRLLIYDGVAQEGGIEILGLRRLPLLGQFDFAISR